MCSVLSQEAKTSVKAGIAGATLDTRTNKG